MAVEFRQFQGLDASAVAAHDVSVGSFAEVDPDDTFDRRGIMIDGAEARRAGRVRGVDVRRTRAIAASDRALLFRGPGAGDPHEEPIPVRCFGPFPGSWCETTWRHPMVFVRVEPDPVVLREQSYRDTVLAPPPS